VSHDCNYRRAGAIGATKKELAKNLVVLMRRNAVEKVGRYIDNFFADKKAVAGRGAHEARQVSAGVKKRAGLRVVRLHEKIVSVDTALAEIVTEPNCMGAGASNYLE
jgi:hypothetical protein